MAIFDQVEKILYLVTEMTSMIEQKEECMEEVENTIAWLPSLLASTPTQFFIHSIFNIISITFLEHNDDYI